MAQQGRDEEESVWTGAPRSRQSSGDAGGSVRGVGVAGNQGLRLLCEAPTPVSPAESLPEVALWLLGSCGSPLWWLQHSQSRTVTMFSEARQRASGMQQNQAQTRCPSCEHGASR